MSNIADRELVKGAVEDVKALKEAALEAAKNRLAEELTPKLKALLEEALEEKRGLTGRGKEMSQRADYMSPKLAQWEESKDKGEEKMAHDGKEKKGDKEELDLESIASFFPNMTEEPDPDPDPDIDPSAEHDMDRSKLKQGKVKMDPSAKPDEAALPQLSMALGEEPECDPDHDGDEHMKKEELSLGESVEISESELKKVYEEALQTEVQVKKGFSDMSKSGELEEVDPGAGLLTVKKGEAYWEDEEPPAAEKRIPEAKVTVRQLIEAGAAENKRLAVENKQLRVMVQKLAGKLHEVNLFNAKVLFTNRILNSGRLSKEQRQVAMESIDKARSIAEAKVVYEAVVNSFKAAAALVEGRKPKANVQGARTSGSPKQEVLRESVDHGTNEKYARFAELAGLVK